MQGAMIGFGTIGMGHLVALRQVSDMTITSLVDPVHERRMHVNAMYPEIRTYKSFQELAHSETIDFIDICSPPHTHLDYIRTGLSNNYHILCEKPFLLSVSDYKGILASAKKANRILYPCHNYKFAPILQKFKEIAQAPSFGQIVSGHFRTLRSGHAVGVPEWNPHWRRNPSISGGGILRDHGPHSIYTGCHIYKQFPNSVSCLVGNLRKDGYQDTEDTALLTLYFDSNVRLVIDLSWAANFRNSFYAIYGTSENIIIENDELCHTTRAGNIQHKSIVSEFNDPSHKSWFLDMFDDFKAMINSPEHQFSLLQEALITSLVIEGAYESAKKGGVQIEIPYPSHILM